MVDFFDAGVVVLVAVGLFALVFRDDHPRAAGRGHAGGSTATRAGTGSGGGSGAGAWVLRP